MAPGRAKLHNPLGVNGFELMAWFFHTRVWRKMHGGEEGETGVDNTMAEQGFAGIGAWILGRNMFGPIRGPWADDSWKGWWGEAALSHACLRAHALPAGAAQDGGRYRVSFRY